ncbi:hypothetical protein G3A43_07930 [Paraburkholderia aspalathi]|nr:hypothetical protein [Paraburkholderia aspalathi]MBK3780184.1 hypothetical protein [Paraburkholderia aspalathi]
MDTNAKAGNRPRDAEEWMPWAEKLLRTVKDALENGIPAEHYAGYPTPAEGFCFELHADLPYGPARLPRANKGESRGNAGV